MGTCPICNESAKESEVQPNHDFTCERCGNFSIPIKFLKEFENKYKKDIPLYWLSGFVREYSDHNGDYYYFTCDKNEIELIKKQVPRDNDVIEKARKLLLAIGRKSKYPGQSIELPGKLSYPLAYCQNDEEFDLYLNYLEEQGLINGRDGHSIAWGGFITVDGWRAIESYKVPNAESKKVFVAMWFAPQMDDAYNSGIQPALENDCGYKSIRIDKKEFLGKVDDEIIAEIRESRFIVADFTEQRNGVYFEAGFAQGLGLPVIWTCRKDYADKLHFDTRQENHIIWEKPDELREKLKNRINAEIRLGPYKSI